jgi:transcriptional regulator with XRE-family HTH domain
MTNAEIGKRIRVFRVRRGMTQAKLGYALGYTSHVPIVNIESGKHDVSLIELERIANILRVPLQYLIPSLPVKRQSNALSIALRTNSILTSKEKGEIIRYYELKWEQRQKAKESILGGLSLRTPEGARALARYHLRELGVTKPPLDLNYALFHWNIEYDERDLGDKISGFLLRDGLIRVICVNSIHVPFRKRMTTAHELGHFHLDTAGFDCTISADEDYSEEELAFQYAHELLMPSDWLKENKEQWQRNPVGVSLECQVSPIACEKWARALGVALPAEPELKRKHEEILDKWERSRVTVKGRK